MEEQAMCELCGAPMPAGEEMFKYHGYSGNCPNPPIVKYFKVGNTGLELVPTHVSHKRVAAAKIGSVLRSETSTLIDLEGIPSLTVENSELLNKPSPAEGWYLVVYDNGYFSFSPATAFEDGYTRIN